MTKNKAKDIARKLNVACDEPYIFSVKIGAGCLNSVTTNGDSWILFTLLINILDSVMNNLKKIHQDKFRQLLCLKLLQYLNDQSPAQVPEQALAGKLLKKRIKHNDAIIDALEDVLSKTPCLKAGVSTAQV